MESRQRRGWILAPLGVVLAGQAQPWPYPAMGRPGEPEPDEGLVYDGLRTTDHDCLLPTAYCNLN